MHSRKVEIENGDITGGNNKQTYLSQEFTAIVGFLGREIQNYFRNFS